MQFTPSLVLWYLVVIGILITAHEYGHYRVAIACKVKVFRFSIGFGRVLWRRPFGPPGCEFTLSAIPLGGYVAMLEKPEDAATPEDAAHALESRPLWQRCAVVLAGPAANLLLAVVFFAVAQFMGTQQTVPVLSTPPAGSLLAEAGQRSGDRLVAWAEDGEVDAQGDPRWKPLRSYEDVLESLHDAMLDGRGVTFEARRLGTADSRMLALPLDRLEKSELDASVLERVGLTSPLSPPLVRETLAGGAALAAGLKAGDLVEFVDGEPVADAQSLIERIRASVAADGTARTLAFQVRRDGQSLTLPVRPKVVTENGRRFGRIGANIGAPYLEELVRDDLGGSIAYGFTQTAHTALMSLRIFGRMLVGQASLKNLGGPLTISDQVRRSAEVGLSRFLSMLAAISVGIGVLNLLPIPVLDGGRLLYYLYEGAAGRPVSTSWQDKLRYGGVFAILLLMSIALSNDLARFLGQ
jgi:regulator of sigma E protease